MAVRELRGRRCLITGAASGIGRATALAAGREGALLFLTDLDAEKLDATAAALRAEGSEVAYLRALDIADYEAVRTMAEEIHREHGSIDVVMNIAGIATWGTVDRLEHRHWRRIVDVNLMGPIHVVECFLPPMIDAGRGGHLVNVSSAAGLFGLPWHAAYSATKFGVRGLSEVLRFDLRRHNIGVSLVCPGGVDTGLVDTVQIVGVDRDDPRIGKLTKRFRKRAVSPERAAEAIIAGVKRNRYMVYTSRDIQIGHFVQRKFALPYEIAMQIANDRFSALGRAASKR